MSSRNAAIRLTGVILAGGLATRMGGGNKGLMTYRGHAMVQWVSQAMQEVTTRILVNANGDRTGYDALGFDSIEDQDHCQKGPLSGVLRALQVCQTSHLLLCPCDTPNISSCALQALAQAAGAEPSKIHYLHTLRGAQPLHAVLPVASALPALKTYLSSEHYRVLGFYQEHGASPVDWHSEEELLNINHKHELS